MRHRFAALAVTLLLAPVPALANHPFVADQGGRLAEAHGHRLELVTQGSTLDILLKDEHNQPLSAAGYSGKAVVMAPGGKAEVSLVPAGNRLSGPLPAGAELAAAVVVLKADDGHSMNARFPALQAAPAPDAALAAQGKPVYDARCASCHGARLQGQAGWQTPASVVADKKAPPLDATGHGWHHADEQLAQAIRQGAAPMPAFATTLKEAEIGAVIAYIKSTWPAATLAQQPVASSPATTAPAAGAAMMHDHHHSGM